MNRVGCAWMLFAFVACWFFADLRPPAPRSPFPGEAVAVVERHGGALRNLFDSEGNEFAVCMDRKKQILGAVELFRMENNGMIPADPYTLRAQGFLAQDLHCPSGGAYRIEPRGDHMIAVVCDRHGEYAE